MTGKNIFLFGLGGALLIAMTVGASAYVTKSMMEDDKPMAAASKSETKTEKITWNDQAAQPAPQPVQQVQNCNDGNVVGAVVGGLGGGVAGSQVGKGNGKTVGTIAGALGGAYLGKEYLPTHNITCAK